MKKRISFISLLLVLSMLLAACKDTPTTTTTASSATSSSTTTSTSTSSSTSGDDGDEIKGVCINEVAGKNDGAILAPDGEERDWIELYNNASTVADISGWMLSNDIDALGKFVFPSGTTIAPYGYLIIWAIGSELPPAAAGLYASFKVSASGEDIILANNGGAPVDSISVPAVDGNGRNWTYGRTLDAGFSWSVCDATPLQSNNNSAKRLPLGLFTVSSESGFYDDAFDVSLSVESGYTLKYTTDCSDPATSKTAITWSGEAVHVYDPSNDPVRYSNINVQTASGSTMWAPKQIDQCFVLRVAAVDEDGIASEVSTYNYFVGFDEKDGYSGLPIVSLTSDPDGLYSKNGGLFVLNYGESEWSASTHDTRDWERQTNFAMFDANGKFLFDQEVGIKIRGTSTRGAAQKSLNVYAREEYGNKEFSEEVFGTRTRSIVLRNDFAQVHHLGQGYLQDLISDRDVLTQESYPVLVFLEGEYCGLYILYERFSENFVEDHYGITDDNIWTAKKFAGDWGAEFDAPNAQSLLACQKDLNDIFVYIRDHDMSKKEHYDYVCSKIDMDSLIDLLCFQLYIGNVDFSLAQNISAWRAIEVDPTNPYADGRWRFVVYDLDFAMLWSGYNVSSNPFTEAQPYAGGGFLDFKINTCYFNLRGDKLVQDSSREIKYDFADKIMASPLFCEQFVKTMQDLGNFNFAPDRVKAALDEQLALISPVYANYRKRVVKKAYENTDPDVDEQLINNLMNKYNSYLDYFNRRYAIITGYMASAFSLKGTQNKVTIAVSGVDDALLKINTSTNTISKNGMQVSYYSDYNVTFEAMQSPEGYTFDHWEVSGGQLVGSSATDTAISVSMEKNASLSVTAIYVPVS